jgi:DNA primase
MHLAESIDISHADGKARFVAEARPLLERMPEGPYRELLLDRLAEAIGVSAERFLKIVGPMAAPESSGPNPAQPPPRPPRTARSAGRGSLVRQAVQTLLHFPGAAARIPAAEVAALGGLDEPGVEILVQLLEGVRQQPAASTGQLLERWRDHPAAERLGRLAAESSIIPDEAAALDELKNALQKLAQGAAAAELDALITKEQGPGLTPAERDRLRELLQRKP